MESIIKILHLEDLPSDSELVDRELKRGNLLFEKKLVDTKEDYVNAINEFKPDIILSDHSLPSFNSFEALKILEEKRLSVPFILVTATISEEFAVNMMHAGAGDYILKDRLQRLPVAITSAIAKNKLEKERQRFIESVIENESLMREAERLAHFGSWQYNTETRRISFSHEMFAILGYPKNLANPHPHTLLEKVHPDDKNDLVRIIDNIRSGKANNYKLTFRLLGKNNDVKFISAEVVVFKDLQGKITSIRGFCQDITAIKNKELELIATSNALRELTSHLQDIREQERAAIAREIHDALGQQLTALKIDIVWFLRKLNLQDENFKEKGNEIVELINSTISMVRKIATQLRPSILDDMGLAEALRWQSDEFEKRTGIQVNFTASDDLPPTNGFGIALFRIFQESLTNIARHADASAVEASLLHTNRKLTLTIADNGKGFDYASTMHKGTLGLLGMRERIHMLGGTYDIKTAPGQGTTVTVSLPL